MMADFYVTMDSMWQNDGTFETITSQQEPIPKASLASSVRLQRKFMAAQDFSEGEPF